MPPVNCVGIGPLRSRPMNRWVLFLPLPVSPSFQRLGSITLAGEMGRISPRKQFTPFLNKAGLCPALLGQVPGLLLNNGIPDEPPFNSDTRVVGDATASQSCSADVVRLWVTVPRVRFPP